MGRCRRTAPRRRGRRSSHRRRTAPAARRGRRGTRMTRGMTALSVVARASISPTTTDPSSAPSTVPAARWVATSGPGTRARPSSSKTRAASASPRPTPSSDPRARQRLNTPASPSSRQSVRSTTWSADSTARTARAGTGPRTACACPRPARSGARSARSPRSAPLVPRPVMRWSGPGRLGRPGAPSAGRGCARRRCCAGSARCPRRW